jgi:hypothetical protein
MVSLRLLGVLGLCAYALAQLPVTSLFQVGLTGTADGSCGGVGQAALDSILRDCLTMANAGVSLMNADNKEADRLRDAFYSGHNIGHRRRILGK